MQRVIAIFSFLLAILGVQGACHAQGIVPPPPQQYTADCNRPVYATDYLVCADPELRAQDDSLRHLLADRELVVASSYIESDADWFKRRGLCAFEADHSACARGAYLERIALLRVIAMPRPAKLEPVRCTGTGAGWLGRVGEVQILYDAQGQPLVAAMRADAHRPWKDFSVYSRSAKRVAFLFRDGRKMRCDMRPGH